MACVFCGAWIAACGSETFVTAPATGDGGGPAGPDGAVADAASAPDVSSAADVTAIPIDCGKGMVRVSFASTPFCIDRVEVTQAAYQQFLETRTASAPALALPTRCTAKVDFAPTVAGDCLTNRFSPGATPDMPVSCVDWCDAWAYCDWAGKIMCTVDAWYNACSQNGARIYPYGSDYVQSHCGTDGSMVRPTASQPACEGAAPGLFDMSGNVAEWVDACSDSSVGSGGANVSQCRVRGGHYGGGSTTVGCPDEVIVDKSTRTHQIGFRCCSRP